MVVEPPMLILCGKSLSSLDSEVVEPWLFEGELSSIGLSCVGCARRRRRC
jgi:hypothetical protein